MIIFVNLVGMLLLVFMNGFFVATEFAIVKVRKSRIETLVQAGNKGAVRVKKIIDNLNSYLSACQLGITLASLGLGWIGEPAISKLIEPILEPFHLPDITIEMISFIVGYSIVTTLHVVLGELVPKSLAIITAEKISLMFAGPLIFFFRATYPIIWLFNKCTALILRMFGLNMADETDEAHSDEEIVYLVEESYKQGLINESELEYVENIFDFSEKTVREIMTHRTEMICINDDASFEQILEIARKDHHSRFPVCHGNKDNILGFIHIKDVYQQKLLGDYTGITAVLREVPFVHETMSIQSLFTKLQKEKSQIAIIVDEYGGTSGIVSIEDVMESIVGEIQDEFDDEEEEIIKLDENTYSIHGNCPIDKVNKELFTDIETDDADSISGWLCLLIEKMPEVNQEVLYQNFKFTILECKKNYILKIKAERLLTD